MKSIVTAAAVVALSVSGHARAESEPTELVNAQHCMACHMIDKPFLAPSFEQIANRYRGDPLAVPTLATKLSQGGPAHWGDMPMPASVDRGGPLSDADARRLAHWVLDR
jgi:cytochrome c